MSSHTHSHDDHAGHAHGVSAEQRHALAARRAADQPRLHGRRGRRRRRSPTRWRCSPTRRTCSPTPARSAWRSSRCASRGARRRARSRSASSAARSSAPRSTASLLFVLAGVIGIESISRIVDPPDVDGAFVLYTRPARRRRQRRRRLGARQGQPREPQRPRARSCTTSSTCSSSIAAAVAGLVIVLTGWGQADGIAALAVSLLMLYGGWGLDPRLRPDPARGRAQGPRPQARSAGRWPRQPGVVEVHDLHVWEVTSGFPALAAHVLVAPATTATPAAASCRRCSSERFAIAHTTLQVDHELHFSDELLEIERPPAS